MVLYLTHENNPKIPIGNKTQTHLLREGKNKRRCCTQPPHVTRTATPASFAVLFIISLSSSTFSTLVILVQMIPSETDGAAYVRRHEGFRYSIARG